MDYITNRSQLRILLVFCALLGDHVAAFVSVVRLSWVDLYKRCSAAWFHEHSLRVSHAFVAGRDDEGLKN